MQRLTLYYKTVRKLLLLDNKYPPLITINNLFFFILAPFCMLYQVISLVVPLPFDNIITLSLFSSVFIGWIIVITLLGVLYYSLSKVYIMRTEQHLGTIQTPSESEVKIYSTRNTNCSETLSANLFRNHKTLPKTENENRYIVMTTTPTPLPFTKYTYDSKFIINIYSFIVGLNVTTEEELVSYIQHKYDKDTIHTIFDQGDDTETNELQTAIHAHMLSTEI